jgi:hypothetical protein
MGDTVHEQIERTNRRAQESTATHEDLRAQALRRYADSKRWTGRRFRVEGTGAGNSFLMGKKRAEATQRKYGGRVVDAIGIKPKGTSKREEQAAALPACPTCGAAAGLPCVRRSPTRVTVAVGSVKVTVAKNVAPHKKRIAAHEGAKADANRELGAKISKGRARTADGAAELPRSS